MDRQPSKGTALKSCHRAPTAANAARPGQGMAQDNPSRWPWHSAALTTEAAKGDALGEHTSSSADSSPGPVWDWMPGLREQRAAFTALTPRRDRVANSLDAFMGCNQCTGRVGLPAISSLREHFIHTQAGWKGKKRPCMFLNAGGSYCMRGFNPSPKTSPCPAGWGQGHAAWLGSGSAAELLCNGHKSTRTCKQGREQRTWRDAMASGREGRGSSAGGWRPRKTSDQACECSWPHILQVDESWPCSPPGRGAHRDRGRASPTAPAALQGHPCGTLH